MRDRTNWIKTYSGNPFWPLEPRTDEVRLEDIAHALSMQCRFTGHCLRFYSVAEHSVFASRLVPPEWAKEALLHDAAEAYIHDMASPIKRGFLNYKEIEDCLEAVIGQRFSLRRKPWSPAIKQVDMRLVKTEDLRNMKQGRTEWQWDPVFDNVEPYWSLEFNFWGPGGAEAAFLDRAKEIGIR